MPPALERVDRRVEHEADPGERLHRAVVEEERQPPALVLLGDDQLVREPRALGLAHLGLGEQARVLDRAAGEVGEHAWPARASLAVERPRAHQLQRADLLAPDDQRQLHGPRCPARSPAGSPSLWLRRAASPRGASARATRSGSCVAAISPIDSISDSRKLACAVSSSSASSWRRRSVTIRWSAKRPRRRSPRRGPRMPASWSRRPARPATRRGDATAATIAQL